MKPQEAIPPFSLIEVSIHGRRAETLVKTAKSCWLHSRPSRLLTIPTRMWLSSSLTTVSGPPLSPWVKLNTDGNFWQPTLHGPSAAPPPHTIRFSSTPSVSFILSIQLLLGTMGSIVSCNLSVDVSWTPVSPQPAIKTG